MPVIDKTGQPPCIIEGTHALLPKLGAHGNDGPGISERVSARVFKPLLTTNDLGKSTSIHLDTSHRIVVEQHGGDIYCTSAPGESRFQLRLPMNGSVGEVPMNVVRSLEVGQ